MMKVSLILILFCLGACATAKIFTPTEGLLPAMQQKVPGITMEEAHQGYKLYTAKCAGCHRLHAPSEYTVTKWEKSLSEMFPKAKVEKDDEKKLIRDYVIALSK